ncbi:hypothetical protein PoB_000901600 [Plakobranchus ocellatus]|uniref:Uncharacterized protein n=1 Tax=Plakobranchus ocellatus TaxID=259542 RepID=A0AAV3YJI2_9GAST|nr:hypothetical protein PoB_000901600 [Plakobranchus ocellatus]
MTTIHTSYMLISSFGFYVQRVHNKVISGFQALRQAGVPVTGLEPATEESLQISGQVLYPICQLRSRFHRLRDDDVRSEISEVAGRAGSDSCVLTLSRACSE